MVKFKNALNKKNAIVIGKKIGFEYFKINLKIFLKLILIYALSR